MRVISWEFIDFRLETTKSSSVFWSHHLQPGYHVHTSFEFFMTFLKSVISLFFLSFTWMFFLFLLPVLFQLNITGSVQMPAILEDVSPLEPSDLPYLLCTYFILYCMPLVAWILVLFPQNYSLLAGVFLFILVTTTRSGTVIGFSSTQ